jgi:myo-inositol-1(or 4)-monophosphatase
MRYSYTETAIAAALRAGSILREMQGRVEVEFKGVTNLVTKADRAAERAVLEIIRDTYPDHAVCAEESGAAGIHQCCWYIDPLDGTTNYAHGLPLYSVSIGVAENGQMLVGVIYVPASEELFVAERGGGAYRNGAPIKVSRNDTLMGSLLVTGFPYFTYEGSDNNLDHFGSFLVRSRAVRRLGSAALDLARLAQGAFDGYWEIYLYPWDMAAGALLVQEAGGTISDLRGEPWTPESHQILASNGHIHTAMLEVLKLGRSGMEVRKP